MTRNLLFILISLLPVGLTGQISHLSNLYSLDKLAFNPAFAGSREALSLTAFYRNQWVGFDDAPKNYSFSAHAPLHNDRMGLGLLMEKSSMGIFKETNFVANYAYNIELSNARLAFGLGFGATIYNMAWNELVSSTGGDILLMNNPETATIPNFSLGTYYYTRNYFIGISIPFLLGRELDEISGEYHVSYDLNRNNFHLIGGYAFQLDPQFRISPSLLLKYQPNGSIQIDYNLQLSIKDRISLGLGYRNEKTMIGMLEVQLNHQLRMAYACDFDLSPLGKYKGASHEIGINYIFSFERNVMGPRQF
jgi:type IX secretion system PorP/SprF family membrane protein